MKINTTDILLIALVALLTWNIRGCFTKVQKPEKMIRNEVELEHLRKELIKDSLIHVIELAEKDSVINGLKGQFAATTPKLQQSKKDYEKVRPVINGLTDNELLQRANNFTPK